MRKILNNFPHKEILPLCLVHPVWNAEAKRLLKARGKTCARIGSIRLEDAVRFHNPVHIRSDLMLQEDIQSRRAPRWTETRVRQANALHQPLTRNLEAKACEDVYTFARLTRTMNFVPFSQLWLQIKNRHSGPCLPIDQQDIIWMVERVPITALHFEVFTSTGENTTDCTGLRFLEFLLKANAYRLVELSAAIPAELTLEPDVYLNTCQFSRLKSLVFYPRRLTNCLAAQELTLLRAIVSTAPYLQTLELKQSIQAYSIFHDYYASRVRHSLVRTLFDTVLEGSKSTTLIIPGEIWCDAELSDEDWSRLSVRNLMQLPSSTEIDDGGAQNRRKLRVRTLLMQNSYWTLISANFDVLTLATAFQHKIQFQNLRQLNFMYSKSHLQRDCPGILLAVLKSHGWKHCFPRIEKLQIHGIVHREDARLLTELKLELLHVMMSNPGREIEDAEFQNLQELQMEVVEADEAELELLQNLCRNVRRLEVRPLITKESGERRFGFAIEEFWTQLPALETIKIDARDFHRNEFDCILCGLSPSEYDKLEKMDAEFLKNVHIVPQKPPLTWLKSKHGLPTHAIIQAT